MALWRLSSVVVTIDPTPLGKVDKSTLSQQTLMELLIEGIENRELICGSKENPQDVVRWKGITQDCTGKITVINWQGDPLGMRYVGKLSPQWIPPTVTSFSIVENDLSGSLDLRDLPGSLCGLNAGDNNFEGDLHLSSLPPEFEFLDVANNHFSGYLDLDHLPGTMRFLYLQCNEFFGNASLVSLPKDLESLDLSQNNLSGGLDLSQLPENLRTLYLYNNAFSGVTDFSKLPDSLDILYVSDNRDLSGEIYVTDSGKDFYAEKSKVQIIRPE
mmetsp:Transcript_33649/g.52606  ORF Transcript_33649/g.52606 Transcript_33649/m.52606 type:complete len:272 (-) Transcript_33649:79-894(-)